VFPPGLAGKRARMATPEVHRSGHTPVSPDHAAEVADLTPDAPSGPSGGAIPPENRPGHHPEVEQDKPRRRPPSGGRRSRRRSRTETGPEPVAGADTTTTFEFAFEPRIRPAALMVGVTPRNARVEVDDSHLTVRFGRWTLRTPVANVADTQVTGPYAWWKVAGPPHLSMSDGGITFATTTAGGVCISFHEPVPAMVPGSAIRHPGATVTVRDPQALVAALEEAQLRVLAAAGGS
jgi:hypothetical protein